MARWEPGSRERLQESALELFAAHGYDQTTVTEIAARAGVTDRTFFRYFSDKREVLFAGSEVLEALFVDTVGASTAPDPLLVVEEALDAAAAFFAQERRPWSQRRQALVEQNPALAEREQLKMVTLATAVASALRGRGVDEPAASLLAHSAITVFQVSFAAWIRDGEERPMAHVQRTVFRTLRETLGAPAGAGART